MKIGEHPLETESTCKMFCHGNVVHQNLGLMSPEPCSMSMFYSWLMSIAVLFQPVWRPVAQWNIQDEWICFRGHCLTFVGLWPWQTGISHVTLSLIGRWMVMWCPMRAFPGCTIYLEKHALVHWEEVWVLFEGVRTMDGNPPRIMYRTLTS